MKKYVSQKIAELDSEIAKFKNENLKVKAEKSKYDNLLKELAKEKDTFLKYKQIAVEEVENFKAEEIRKAKQDKKV